MTDEMKLLRAFIEASGFEIETDRVIKLGRPRELTYQERQFGGRTVELNFQGDGLYCEVTRSREYKVTKRAKAMMHPVVYSVCDGDLFSLGCQVANDDIKDRLKLLGFELDKDQMHDVMETIIFHIAK